MRRKSEAALQHTVRLTKVAIWAKSTEKNR